jgi:hypothetical protein
MLASLGGYILGFYVGCPQVGRQIVISNIVTVVVWGQIHIEISPNGYPSPGQMWTMSVYSVNITSNHVFFTPSTNSTVMVYVMDLGVNKIYSLPVDEKGRAEFTYQSEYSDVAFQAFCGNFTSEKVVFSVHYVSSNIVDTMLSISGPLSAVTGMAGITVRKKKMNSLISVLLIGAFVLFALVTVFAFYCVFFFGTVWGYPENVFDGLVTLSLLKYLAILGIALFSASVLIALILRLRH